MMIKQATGSVAAALLFVSPVAAQYSADAAQPTVVLERHDATSAALTAGLSAYTKGDFAAAISINTQLLHDNPAFPNALFNRGRAYAALKQFPEAERDFSAYCRLTPTVMDGYLERGRVRRAQGRLKNALSDFSLIIDRKIPYGDGTFFVTARPSLMAEACLERAVTHYRIGLSNDINGRGRSAAYEAALKDFDTALAKAQLRVELTPSAVFNRAVVAEAQASDPLATPTALVSARYETAAAGYETYLQFVPKSPDARAVREHIAQIFVWLSGDETSPRPIAPTTFSLKPLP